MRKSALTVIALAALVCAHTAAADVTGLKLKFKGYGGQNKSTAVFGVTASGSNFTDDKAIIQYSADGSSFKTITRKLSLSDAGTVRKAVPFQAGSYRAATAPNGNSRPDHYSKTITLK